MNFCRAGGHAVDGLTSTRRRAGTIRLAWLVVATIALCSGESVQAATFTVSPGQSIQSAINAAAAGDTVVVQSGIYTGGVTLNKAITLRGEPGATLRASTSGSGDGVKIASDNCTVEGLRIENFSMAIAAYNNPKSNVRVLNNHTYRNQFSCWIDGQNWLIEGNNFERAYYWSGTGDCDYTRMFGRGHVFRRNYIHGSIIPTDLAPLSGSDYAHLDGIQWFGNSGNGEVFQNILIEENYLTDIVQGFYISNPNSTGDIDGVTIRNNVIWGQNNPEAGQLGNRPVWGTLFGSGNGLYPARNTRFENNLLYNIVTNLAGTGGHQGVWQKNIFIAKPNNYSVAYYTEGGSTAGLSGTGDWLFRIGDVGEWSNPGNIFADPLMVNESNPLGADGIPFTADDGWRPGNSQAATFGPQYVAGGGTPPPPPATTVTANDDAFASIPEDSTNNTLNVLANDTISPVNGDTLTVVSVGAASQGGTVTIVSGTSLRYTPRSNFFGGESFVYTARDSAGNQDTATVTVTVTAVNDPPTGANDSYTVLGGSSNNIFTVLTNDSISPDTGETLTVSAIGPRSNGGTASINQSTRIAYTPSPSFSGVETFTYTLRDSNGGTATATVSVTVQQVNNPPAANNDSFSGIQKNSSGNVLNVLANDSTAPDTGETLAIVSRTTPNQGGTVSIGTGVLIYTPLTGFSGVESFSYTVSDGRGGTDSANVSVTVENTNGTPVANNDSYNVNENSSANTLTVLNNDYDPDNDPLTIVDLTEARAGGTVSLSGSNLLYSPPSGFVGTETFTYTVSDGKGGQSTASVSVSVQDLNTSPVALADAYTVNKNSSGNELNVCNNDSDPDAGDIIAIVDPGRGNKGGTISVGSSTGVVYTPAANYIGIEEFTYTIADANGARASAKCTVTVQDTAPRAKNDRYKVRGNSKNNTLTVTMNDTSTTGSELTVEEDATVSRKKANGQVVMNGKNVIYTPPQDFIGIDTFTYTVKDENNERATAEVTVEVSDEFGLDFCDDYPAFLAQLGALWDDLSVDSGDVDGDSIPDNFMLEAMQVVSCFEADSELGSALKTAYLVNLIHFDAEGNAVALADYREVIAALLSMNESMQIGLLNTLANADLGLTGLYENVWEDAAGFAMPQPIPGISLGEGYQVFEETRAVLEQPFSAEGDIDNDGHTNLSEYLNVVAAGGGSTEFANSVNDPELDGSDIDTRASGGGGGGCFIATAAYGTPLAAEIGVLRNARDRFMLTSALGSIFADAYYRLSPPVARIVADHPAVAGAVRVALEPIVALARALLAAPAAALALGVLLPAALALSRLQRRRQRS